MKLRVHDAELLRLRAPGVPVSPDARMSMAEELISRRADDDLHRAAVALADYVERTGTGGISLLARVRAYSAAKSARTPPKPDPLKWIDEALDGMAGTFHRDGSAAISAIKLRLRAAARDRMGSDGA